MVAHFCARFLLTQFLMTVDVLHIRPWQCWPEKHSAADVTHLQTPGHELVYN